MENASKEWRPIADYECDPSDIADPELRALSKVWIEQRSTLVDSTSMVRFMERLKREWAIETGLIERLYVLDRGVTELMIERGVNVALIPHHTPGDPERTVAMIYDQQAVIEGVFSFVKGDRPLSASYIKELHSLFARNQPFVEGRDQFGRRIQMELTGGAYKKWPNNPTRTDGTHHFYCPPEQVESEMDRLMEWHGNHQGVAPEVEAAWLHHRFVQIHPFQDGNGRVARALASLIFVKADWLPLVVRDAARDRYLDALEEADNGDLKPLVSFFAEIQRREFIKALGVARDVEQSVRVETRIKAMAERLARRRDALTQEWRTVMSSAQRLHTVAKGRLAEICSLLDRELSGDGEFTFFVDDGSGETGRGHWFNRQIISTARTLQYYANFRDYRTWVRLASKGENQGNILISFHGMGHEFRGILACSSSWSLRAPDEDGRMETEEERPLCDAVFQINYKEEFASIEQRFEDWLEKTIDRGLALWSAAL